MTDLTHCDCGCIYEEAVCPNCNYKSPEDRIEELEERNKELTLQLLATSGQAADALDKLTKAVEALRNILLFDDLYPWRIAREVLAELEGK